MWNDDPFGRRSERQPWRDTMQVCLNGHVINASVRKSPHRNKDFCDDCGQRTIIHCPKCSHPIPGDMQDTGVVVIGFSPVAPKFCEKCGEPYPWSKSQPTGKVKLNDPGAVEILTKIFSRFHSLAKLLRKRHDSRQTLDISDEYDVQDFIKVLLSLFFDDVRTEEWTPSYAGKSSRMDFLLKDHRLLIETKMTRKNLTEKEIGDELIIDIARYEQYPDCDTLVCFIYDPEGRINNHKGLIADLQKRSKEKMKVVIFINPQ